MTTKLMESLVRRLIEYVYNVKFKGTIKVEELHNFRQQGYGWMISIQPNSKYSTSLQIAYDGNAFEVLGKLERRLYQDHLYDSEYFTGYQFRILPIVVDSPEFVNLHSCPHWHPTKPPFLSTIKLNIRKPHYQKPKVQKKVSSTYYTAEDFKGNTNTIYTQDWVGTLDEYNKLSCTNPNINYFIIDEYTNDDSTEQDSL